MKAITHAFIGKRGLRGRFGLFGSVNAVAKPRCLISKDDFGLVDLGAFKRA